MCQCLYMFYVCPFSSHGQDEAICSPSSSKQEAMVECELRSSLMLPLSAVALLELYVDNDNLNHQHRPSSMSRSCILGLEECCMQCHSLNFNWPM